MKNRIFRTCALWKIEFARSTPSPLHRFLLIGKRNNTADANACLHDLHKLCLLLFSTCPFIPVSPFCHSRENGNPDRTRSRIKCGMTGGDGSRIKCGMTKNVSFPHPFCHSRENGNPDRTRSPIRSALLSVEDDKGCVIPVKTGIQARLDPQSEALRFRLRMTRGCVISAPLLSFP